MLATIQLPMYQVAVVYRTGYRVKTARFLINLMGTSPCMGRRDDRI